MSFTTAKSVELDDLGSMETFDQDDGPVVGPGTCLCEDYCKPIVEAWDEYYEDEPYLTPEDMAASTKKCARAEPEDSCNKEFCAALVELQQELVFYKAYLEHQKDKKVNPCVVAGIC